MGTQVYLLPTNRIPHASPAGAWRSLFAFTGSGLHKPGGLVDTKTRNETGRVHLSCQKRKLIGPFGVGGRVRKGCQGQQMSLCLVCLELEG